MIKVFLVEDEVVIRRGIRNAIHWEEEGFEFAGEAGDGELALPLVQRTKPDILITDIRMPFMDGLELSRRLKAVMPDLHIIILSGYDDFHYAQEGISIGVEDYLLKPVTAAQLLSALRKIADRIREQRSAEDMDALSRMKDSLQVGELDLTKFDQQMLTNFLKTAKPGETDAFVQKYLSNFGESNLNSLLFRQYTMMDLYLTAARVLNELGIPTDSLVERCGDVASLPLRSNSIEETAQFLTDMFRAVIELRDQNAQSRPSSAVAEALNYIRRNYSDPEISLNAVASAAGLSPNHFSTVFRQETGKTFVEYLTELRMEKARELLRSSNEGIGDIAFEVGYRDPHYFSSQFRKMQGVTPREYRLG